MSTIYPRLLLSLTPSTWSKRFLTHLSISTNLNQLLSYQTFINSSIAVKPIPSNFENAQAISNGTFIMKLTKKPKCSILRHSTHVKIHGNSAKRVKAMIWKMMFQASDLKENQFLGLLDDDNNIIKPSYTKGGSWLKLIGHLNSLCAQATRVITNHASTGKYRLRFFPREEFNCSCRQYPIESRRYILHKCSRFNGYWNLRRDTLSHFVMFLEFNPSTFSFS